VKPLREWISLAPKAREALRKWGRVVPSDREVERLRWRVAVG
jgi:hypothetical protein